jgi:hypothetical protein
VPLLLVLSALRAKIAFFQQSTNISIHLADGDA